MKIVGRKLEKTALKKYENSNNPEFVAVYGRRRVGKTFLIRESFNNDFAFQVTGLANVNIQKQLQNFNMVLNRYGSIYYPIVNTWLDAFNQLIHLLEYSSYNHGHNVWCKTKRIFQNCPVGSEGG